MYYTAFSSMLCAYKQRGLHHIAIVVVVVVFSSSPSSYMASGVEQSVVK